MSELRAPLKDQLEDTAPEQELRGTWRKVQTLRARREARRELYPALRLAMLGTAIALAVLLVVRIPNPFAARAPGPLLVEDSLPGALDARKGPIQFSDGSRVDLAPSARLEVVDNSGRAFVSVLQAGTASFDVQPGGPRRWTIEAGLVSVEVVGTRFSVTRAANGVEVEVQHGIVLVRGERVPDRIQRLTAGQRLRVEASVPAPAKAPETAPAVTVPAPAGPASVHPAPSASVKVGFDTLLQRADAQRRAGDIKAAEATLDAAAASAPDRGRAALAAFTLGKLLLDGSGRPADAARAFSRSIALGPPASIAEDALARLVEAEGRAGHAERARAAARQYAERYPNGPKLYAVTRWLEQR